LSCKIVGLYEWAVAVVLSRDLYCNASGNVSKVLT